MSFVSNENLGARSRNENFTSVDSRFSVYIQIVVRKQKCRERQMKSDQQATISGPQLNESKLKPLGFGDL